MGRPSKLTPEITQAILDVIAAGGTRTVAAEAVGVHRDTIYGWLRRGTEDAKTTQTALDPDDYTIRELRALARAAQIPGFSRMDKGKLAAAIAAKPSEYFQFVRCIKKAEAEAENEWLNGVARIARGVELERATLPLTKGTATCPFDLGVDVRRNRVVLRALAGDELDTFLVAREVAQLHPAIDIVIVEALSRPTTAIYGGLSLVPDCTGPAFPRSC